MIVKQYFPLCVRTGGMKNVSLSQQKERLVLYIDMEMHPSPRTTKKPLIDSLV